MVFTKKEYADLCDTYINDEPIIITGCNFIAQEFETTGKIARTTADELFANMENPKAPLIAITNDTIIVEFGKKKEGALRTDYCASFVTDLYADDPHNFVIKDIKLKKSKKILYQNKDYEGLYEFCRENLIDYGKQLLRHNITPAGMNATCQKLEKFIGRPANIFGQTGVLYIVDSYHKGNIMLYLLDFKNLKEITIPANSKIVEGENLIKISEGEHKETFQDYLLNRNRGNKL